MNQGNCPGIYVTAPAPGASVSAGTPTADTNPPVKPETPQEEGFWHKASPWVHGALGVASFVPGLSVLTGGADAAIYAAEGNLVEAGLSAASMIPGGKVVTTAGKVAKGAASLAKGARATEEAAKLAEAAKVAHEAEEAAKAAKLAKEAEEAAKLKKAEEEAARIKKLEEEAEAGKSGKDGAKVKGKKKLKCGEYGKCGNLKKKTGDGKFDRDQIPSKAALKERAAAPKGDKLTKAEAQAVDNAADAIAIPRQAHIDASPTYGQTVAGAAKDAQDLAGSARRDVEAMLRKIDEYDADGGCKKAYRKGARRVLRKSNAEFDQWLADTLSKVQG